MLAIEFPSAAIPEFPSKLEDLDWLIFLFAVSPNIYSIKVLFLESHLI